MRLQTITHEDDRRKLTEWISDSEIRMCKVLEVKEDSVLGNHYHMSKEDYFYLLRGEGSWVIGPNAGIFREGDKLCAQKGAVHTIYLKAGSILLECSTTPFNADDELKRII